MSSDPAPPAVREVAVTGLGPIGRSLARNIAATGRRVVVHNRTASRTRELVADHGDGLDLVPVDGLDQIATELSPPRVVVCLVKAGPPVDEVIGSLAAHLEPGDVVVDGGNSDFRDTARRAAEMADRGIRYLGMGVSGGEKGALEGPSLMVGGDRSAYDLLSGLLGEVAARVDDEPCRAHLGAGGAGHYVKMVHNGIEYGLMQLIAEVYETLRSVGGLPPGEIADVFAGWSDTRLGSYLVEVTATVLRAADPDGPAALIDRIADRAAQKGTGRLTAQEDLELGTASTVIAEAVSHRSLSALGAQREAVGSRWGEVEATGSAVDRGQLVAYLGAALLGGTVVAYAQGFSLLAEGAREHDFGYRLDDVATIWRGGCIIRARLLDDIREAFRRDPGLANLLADDAVVATLRPGVDGWRRAVATAQGAGVPVPALASALSYLDALRRGRLPAALIQAQRDVFGSHTYERIDTPGRFHADWEAEPVTQTRTDE